MMTKLNKASIPPVAITPTEGHLAVMQWLVLNVKAFSD